MFNLVRHIFNANFLLYNNTFHIHVSTKVEGVVFVSCAYGSIIYST